MPINDDELVRSTRRRYNKLVLELSALEGPYSVLISRREALNAEISAAEAKLEQVRTQIRALHDVMASFGEEELPPPPARTVQEVAAPEPPPSSAAENPWASFVVPTVSTLVPQAPPQPVPARLKKPAAPVVPRATPIAPEEWPTQASQEPQESPEPKATPAAGACPRCHEATGLSKKATRRELRKFCRSCVNAADTFLRRNKLPAFLAGQYLLEVPSQKVERASLVRELGVAFLQRLDVMPLISTRETYTGHVPPLRTKKGEPEKPAAPSTPPARQRKSPHPDDIRAAAALVAEGSTWEEVAKFLGISVLALQEYVAELEKIVPPEEPLVVPEVLEAEAEVPAPAESAKLNYTELVLQYMRNHPRASYMAADVANRVLPGKVNRKEISTVRKILEDMVHSGVLHRNSNSGGRGVTYTIRLPPSNRKAG